MYSSEKTTQAVAKFIKLAGGVMPYIFLLKLLYVADREMLLKWGIPITYDQWYLMKYGPVLGHTYTTIRKTPPLDGKAEPSNYWAKHIRKAGYDLHMVSDPGDDLLSEAEDAIIEKVFGEHGNKEKWEMVEWTHKLPEWRDPGSASVPLSYEKVLLAERVAPEVAARKVSNIRAAVKIASVFAEKE